MPELGNELKRLNFISNMKDIHDHIFNLFFLGYKELMTAFLI